MIANNSAYEWISLIEELVFSVLIEKRSVAGAYAVVIHEDVPVQVLIEHLHVFHGISLQRYDCVHVAHDVFLRHHQSVVRISIDDL